MIKHEDVNYHVRVNAHMGFRIFNKGDYNEYM